MVFRRKRDPDSGMDLPITPMLDMAFQLLTFFVFTYHPSALEGQMALQLPATTEPHGQGIITEPSDAEADLPSGFTVVLTAAEAGRGGNAPVRYVVETPAGPTAPMFGITEFEEYLAKPARGSLTGTKSRSRRTVTSNMRLWSR